VVLFFFKVRISVFSGQAATFLAHIKEGVEIAARDQDALLLFSGGGTRKDAGPRSEAHSYWAIAESKGWDGEFQVTSTLLLVFFSRIIIGTIGFDNVLLISVFGSYKSCIS
jgi:hypothetical protein